MVLLEWLVCRRSLQVTRLRPRALSFGGNGAVYSSSSKFFQRNISEENMPMVGYFGALNLFWRRSSRTVNLANYYIEAFRSHVNTEYPAFYPGKRKADGKGGKRTRKKVWEVDHRVSGKDLKSVSDKLPMSTCLGIFVVEGQ
ncbi:hypothetical protein NL676_012006 [Syzygium grande]|nr:hypothetical protein NL676_012006 [Syzygium grande]